MASEAAIESAIERIAGGGYSAWTIGVTDNSARRRIEHGNPNTWLQWYADTETVARNVERYFLDEGMKGAPGGAGRADYVYIF